MARIVAEIKRGVLRTLYRQAQANGPTPLQDALDAFQDSGFESIKTGRLITAHTGSGKSVTFQLPQIWNCFSQEEVFSLSEELQQVYSDALVTLSSAGNPDPDDAEIFAVMIADDRLATITSTQRDFATLRYPNRL